MKAQELPHESVSRFRVDQTVQKSIGIQAFLQSLTPQERERFGEIAHHIYHEGFEDGLGREEFRTVEEMGKTLTAETEIFAQGAGTLAEEIGT